MKQLLSELKTSDLNVDFLLYFQEQLKPWEIFLQAWIFQYQTSSKSTYSSVLLYEYFWYVYFQFSLL